MKEYRSYAKVNIFLKVTKKRGEYHEILSRFVQVNTLYDTMSFYSKADPAFEIRGDFDCCIEQNTIYKVYQALLEATKSKSLNIFFKTHGVNVEKNIPAFAGLGGGSSNAATFLRMCNEQLCLGLSLDQLAHIGSSVGADIAFFVYNYKSANVKGIGEVVEVFEEDALDLEIITPTIKGSTPDVYKNFSKKFFKMLSQKEYDYLEHASSREILRTYSADNANDLYESAADLYPDLRNYCKDDWFFSGSGSSFFRLKEDNNNG